MVLFTLKTMYTDTGLIHHDYIYTKGNINRYCTGMLWSITQKAMSTTLIPHCSIYNTLSLATTETNDASIYTKGKGYLIAN